MGGAGAVPHSITRGQNGAGPLFDEVAAIGAGGTGYGVGPGPDCMKVVAVDGQPASMSFPATAPLR